MKKSILNLALCAMAISTVTSCTSDEMSNEEKRTETIAQMIVEGMKPGEEAVALSAYNSKSEFVAEDNSTVVSENNSRAAIMNNDDNTGKYFKTDDYSIGLMMLAKKQCDQNIADGKYSEYAPYNDLKVDWTSPENTQDPRYSDTWSVYLDNVRTKADYIMSGTDVVGTSLKFHSADVDMTSSKRFYPTGAYHNYWFYAYAPHVAAADIKKTPTRVSAIFKNLNGKQDLIWGIGKPSITDKNSTYAYSAKYFRFQENRDADNQANPVTMAFEHKLMMVRFFITAGGTPIDEGMPETDRDYTKAYETTVENVQFTNVPAELELILADNEDSNNDGKLITTATRTAYYTLNVNKRPEPTVPGAAVGSLDNKPKKTEVGYLMLPVLDNLNVEPYTIKANLIYEGTKLEMLVPMRLPVSVDKYDSNYFQAGHIYDVILKIHAPEVIQNQATMSPWVEVSVDKTPFINGGVFPIH